ncbi:juvenile hormone esterase [Stomoxys calcitrans]|uniref:juvenile hormone esterase n=1 Tax=Stomoxys calcitrans TaxID=35570 RepID=UPI0027E26E35|nr:juvenile hormone esterase [Stomoxys calcitrans]
MFFVLLILGIVARTSYGLPAFVEVETSLGSVRGLQMQTRFGNKFWGFRGIRYAAPPVAELRFQNPQPVNAWKPMIFDATQDGPRCPQVTKNTTDLSEDCLRLNIYTKHVQNNAKKPVLVYLHPGGFYTLTATSPYAGPEYLMERDIVLVTLNYRLGSLGFLAAGTADAPGNMGLKDQVMALQWIRQHIVRFGGDPNLVTIWGYSAGSRSVGLHMMSPMSHGLFHRAIMMSASPLGAIRYRYNQTDLAERQARLLNCPANPTAVMIKCLKEKPMMAFVNTTEAMFEFEWNPLINWEPVIENDCGQERFLVEDPYKTMLNGNLNKVPLIIGTNEYEFYSPAYYNLRNETRRQRFNDNFAKYAPLYFKYERDSHRSQCISSALYSFYFGNHSLEYPGSMKAFGQLYSDAIVGFNYYRFLKLVEKHVPVYTYFFNYKGRYSFFRNPETNETHGAVHHDELLYLLNFSVKAPIFRKSDPENDLIERFTRMWASFAKTGDPNKCQDEYLKDILWPTYTADRKEYLEIGSQVHLKTRGIFAERLEFWDNLFPAGEMLNTDVVIKCF